MVRYRASEIRIRTEKLQSEFFETASEISGGRHGRPASKSYLDTTPSSDIVKCQQILTYLSN